MRLKLHIQLFLVSRFTKLFLNFCFNLFFNNVIENHSLVHFAVCLQLCTVNDKCSLEVKQTLHISGGCAPYKYAHDMIILAQLWKSVDGEGEGNNFFLRTVVFYG